MNMLSGNILYNFSFWNGRRNNFMKQKLFLSYFICVWTGIFGVQSGKQVLINIHVKVIFILTII